MGSLSDRSVDTDKDNYVSYQNQRLSTNSGAFGGLRILVTGGTGTFGRAFIKRTIQACERLVALGRHELEMAKLEQEFGQYKQLRCFIGDVRDRDRLEMAMRGCDIVIHAAAMKRIEQCERDPIEAVKTNVGGCTNVINAALSTHIVKVIGLSTDKAVNPVNLYGATKLTAERLLIAANNIAGGRCVFSVARYGNIFGSRGSVVQIWRECQRTGQPIFMTDPEATRYFMRIEDAVDMVYDMMSTGKSETRILKLRAYTLRDLAHAMGFVTWIQTELPEWEKKHETLDGVTDSEMADMMSVFELRRELERLS